MSEGNHTTVTEFSFVGFTDDPHLEIILFVVFLLIYQANLVGNVGRILLILLGEQLHTPMYFFICHLSVMDLGYSTTIAPHMLVDFLCQRKVISFSSCVIQFVVFVIYVDAECYTLAATAPDRYAAICRPLHYSSVMSKRVCVVLGISCYFVGLMSMVAHTSLTFSLDFCGPNIINHFFCEIPPLIALSCSDTSISEILLFFFCGFNEFSTIIVILISYFFIFAAILRIRSAEGRRKAFSTCASHLTGVTLFYGAVMFMYTRPPSSYTLDQDKWASVFYTLVNPTMNPLIYSLRNKDVKEAFRRIISKKMSSH